MLLMVATVFVISDVTRATLLDWNAIPSGMEKYVKPCTHIDGCCGSTDTLLTGVPSQLRDLYQDSSLATDSNNQTARWHSVKPSLYQHEASETKFVYLYRTQGYWFAGPDVQNATSSVLRANSSDTDPYNLPVGVWSYRDDSTKNWTGASALSAARDGDTRESLGCLSPAGVVFTIFTYIGFFLLAFATMWNANIVQKLSEAKDKWTEIRAQKALEA